MSLTIKQNDTYPYLRGSASDAVGLLDLEPADKLTVKIVSEDGETTIEGEAEALTPAVEDEEGVKRNWQYKWAAGDTAVPGKYSVELTVEWDSETTPPEIETFPNEGVAELVIEEKL